MEASESWLWVERLTVERAPRGDERGIGLRRVSLALDRGDILVLAGESGCGKSLLCHLVAGVPERGTRVLEGTVRLGGEDLLATKRWGRDGTRGGRIGVVSSEPLEQFNPDRSVENCLKDWMRSRAGGGKGAAERGWSDCFHAVGIVEPERLLPRPVRELSGLMIQRLALMRALLGGAQLIVADDATATLDRVAGSRFIELIRQIREERGTAFLVTSGSLGGVEHYADRVAVFYEGGVVEAGEANRVAEEPAHRYTREFLDCLPRLSQAPGELPGISREAVQEAERSLHDQEAGSSAGEPDASSTG